MCIHIVRHFHQILFSYLNENRISTKEMLWNFRTLVSLVLGALYGFFAVVSFLSTPKCQGYFIDDYELSWVMACDSQKNAAMTRKAKVSLKRAVWPCWMLCEFIMKMGNCTIIHSSAWVPRRHIFQQLSNSSGDCKIQGYSWANCIHQLLIISKDINIYCVVWQEVCLLMLILVSLVI